MITKQISEIRDILNAISRGEKYSNPIALFPHRTGTKNALIEYLMGLPGCCELVNVKNVYNLDGATESSIVFFDFNHFIPTKKELFFRLLDPVITAANDHPLVIVFDDWEGIRHEDMLHEFECALNWLNEYSTKFDIFNCEANVFSNSKAI